MIELKINLAELVRAFSLALDLAEYQAYVNHGQRVAYIATRLGRLSGLSGEDLNSLYFAGLLHDIGLTGAGGTRSLHDERFVASHARLGSQLAAKLPLPGVHQLVQYHHEYYDGSGASGLRGEDIPIGARIVCLADAVDNAMVYREGTSSVREQVCAVIMRGRGSLFDPHLSDLFLTMAREDRLWLDLLERNLPLVLSSIQPSEVTTVDVKGLKAIARVFGEIIDSKSRFTRNHSVGLAELVHKVALADTRLQESAELLYSAALLHDIGKLVIPNEILEKPTQLTPHEYGVIKSHVYYTKLILGQVRGLNQIAEWAGNHHERMDGHGYADRLPARDLALEDRLMAVCDVYQAVIEERPYRSGQSPMKALDIIESMVKSGGLCPEAARLLARAVM